MLVEVTDAACDPKVSVSVEVMRGCCVSVYTLKKEEEKKDFVFVMITVSPAESTLMFPRPLHESASFRLARRLRRGWLDVWIFSSRHVAFDDKRWGKNKQATTTNQELNPTDIMKFELRIFVPWVDSQCFLRTAVHDFHFCALAHSWLFLG